MLILAAVGLVSGTVPAVRASCLNPIELCDTNRFPNLNIEAACSGEAEVHEQIRLKLFQTGPLFRVGPDRLRWLGQENDRRVMAMIENLQF
jgi:hypothetical protein